MVTSILLQTSHNSKLRDILIRNGQMALNGIKLIGYTLVIEKTYIYINGLYAYYRFTWYQTNST